MSPRPWYGQAFRSMGVQAAWARQEAKAAKVCNGRLVYRHSSPSASVSLQFFWRLASWAVVLWVAQLRKKVPQPQKSWKNWSWSPRNLSCFHFCRCPRQLQRWCGHLRQCTWNEPIPSSWGRVLSWAQKIRTTKQAMFGLSFVMFHIAGLC